LCFILIIRFIDVIQATRQEELITELEEDLEAAKSKLQSREKELELWKDRVKRLTVLALGSASGVPPALFLSGFNC